MIQKIGKSQLFHKIMTVLVKCLFLQGSFELNVLTMMCVSVCNKLFQYFCFYLPLREGNNFSRFCLFT